MMSNSDSTVTAENMKRYSVSTVTAENIAPASCRKDDNYTLTINPVPLIPDRRSRLKSAAELLLEEYRHDRELTAFASLDSEDFHE